MRCAVPCRRLVSEMVLVFLLKPLEPLSCRALAIKACTMSAYLIVVRIELLYVPQQQFNILSVHHIKTLGHADNFHGDTVTWNCESSSACTQRIHWIHNLPYLLCTPATQAVMHVQHFQQSSSERDHYHHACLGHMSIANQKILTKLDLVKPESTTKSHTFACEPCIEGTAHKDSYPTLNR